MGAFLDFIKGGNARVIAMELARSHERYGKDFEKVYDFYKEYIDGKARNVGGVGYEEASYILNYEIPKNYVELACVMLRAEAAPKRFSYWEVCESFSKKIESYLRKANIDEKYITGDNSRAILLKRISK